MDNTETSETLNKQDIGWRQTNIYFHLVGDRGNKQIYVEGKKYIDIWEMDIS